MMLSNVPHWVPNEPPAAWNVCSAEPAKASVSRPRDGKRMEIRILVPIQKEKKRKNDPLNRFVYGSVRTKRVERPRACLEPGEFPYDTVCIIIS